jgi:hypothetical protein
MLWDGLVATTASADTKVNELGETGRQAGLLGWAGSKQGDGGGPGEFRRYRIVVGESGKGWREGVALWPVVQLVGTSSSSTFRLAGKVLADKVGEVYEGLPRRTGVQ